MLDAKMFAGVLRIQNLHLTKRALDGWYAPRFFGFYLSFDRFPFRNLILHQPPVTQAVGQQNKNDYSDKTRKLLWGRSGNRCAFCKQELIVSATDKDSEAVVGDECHIISAEVNGPCHDPSYPQEKHDSYENLLLLCRVHHKMVDDQATTFTADILRQLKVNHEIMISEKLSDQKKPNPVRIRRIKKNIPDYLVRVTTGKQLVDLMSGTYAFSMDHDELNSQDEVDLIGSFFQNVSDWSDILDQAAEPSERVESAYHLTQLIKEVEEKGFFVFGAREVQMLEGGIEDVPSNWPVAIVHVLRNDNKSIIFQP